MKRTLDVIGDITSAAKRVLLLSSAAPPIVIELRIGLLPPQPKPNSSSSSSSEWNDYRETEQQRHMRIRREQHPLYLGNLTAGRAQQEAVSQPHIALPSDSHGDMYDLVQQLPHSILALSSFTITSATDGSTLCHAASFDSQHSLDEWIAVALPVDTRLCVTGQAACVDHKPRLFDAMHISFEITVCTPTTTTIIPLDIAAVLQSQPRPATVRDESVQLTTSFRLLPDLTIPLSARLGLSAERKKDAARRMCYSAVESGEPVVVFELVNDDSSTSPLLQAHLHVPDVLSYHRRRVLAAAAHDTLFQQQKRDDRDIVFRAFLSLCPTARLSSFVLAYAPRHYHPVTFEVEVQSDTDVQLRGFHLLRPRLRLQLHNRACGEERSVIRGPAQATYIVAGSEVPVECLVDAAIEDRQPLTVHGDCLSVMRMADILAANSSEPPSATSSPFAFVAAALSSAAVRWRRRPLSSFTALPWTLESTLARQLPWLAPCQPPPMLPRPAQPQQRWNQVWCDYNLEEHTISSVECANLTLSFDPSSVSSPPSSPLCVLLHTRWPRHHGNRYLQLRLRPFLFSPSPRSDFRSPPQNPTTALMSFTALLSLLSLLAESVPPALLHHVQFFQFDANLIVDALTGVAECMAGTADCGPCRRDQLQFFIRLARATAIPAGDDYGDSNVTRVLNSSVIQCLTLQCRPILDPVVFPQLATLTAGRCIEPLYQYVLCETVGGMELSSEQTQEFEHAHRHIAGHNHRHLIHPLQLRPTNGLFALQPHLPAGYLELSLAALTLPAPIHTPSHSVSIHSSSSSLLSSSAFSASSGAFRKLAEGSSEMFRHCLNYLDTNSLLFGLLPAVHSLSSVTAALTNSAYGRRVLLSRYGAWCDVELWSAELLCKWRAEGLEQQRAEVKDRSMCYPEAEFTRRCAQLDCQQTAAHKRGIHWAAIVDLQTRINKFLIRVMMQKKEDVLPQLYHRPPAIAQPLRVSAPALPGAVRPIYLAVPDAAMELLMSVPPFHALPRERKGFGIGTDSECFLGSDTLNNASPHHMDFASFMEWTGVSDGYSLWSLYMGPVYVYENQYTAGRGYEVDMAEFAQRKDAWGQPLIEEHSSRGGKYDKARAVRIMYIDNSNQLPATRRMPFGGTEDIHLYAPTLAACFRATGVSATIDKSRARWTRVAVEDAQQQTAQQTKTRQSKRQQKQQKQKQKRKQAAPAQEEEGDEEAEQEGEEEETKAAGESDHDEDEAAAAAFDEETGDDGYDDDDGYLAMEERDGARLQYVAPLMRLLFEQLNAAMWKSTLHPAGSPSRFRHLPCL